MKLLARLCCVFSVLPMLANAQVPVGYRATVLPFESNTAILNNAGQVAGLTSGRVALWQAGQSLTYLSGQGQGAYVWDMNDHGQMVGDIDGVPTVWQAGREQVQFDAGFYGGTAYGINNKGSIVAIARGQMHEYGYDHSYFVYKDGQRTPVYGMSTWRINEHEQVIGNRIGAGGRGAVWEDEMLHFLPDSGYSWAGGINESGWIAGATGDENASYINATIWKGDQREVYGPGYAYAINDDGMAVGRDSQSAFLLFNGTQYDLNEMWNAADYPGWVLTSANGINNDGVIVAQAQNQGGNWTYMTVLLSPVPEPAGGMLLLAGLALMGGLRLRSGRQ